MRHFDYISIKRLQQCEATHYSTSVCFLLVLAQHTHAAVLPCAVFTMHTISQYIDDLLSISPINNELPLSLLPCPPVYPVYPTIVLRGAPFNQCRIFRCVSLCHFEEKQRPQSYPWSVSELGPPWPLIECNMFAHLSMPCMLLNSFFWRRVLFYVTIFHEIPTAIMEGF